MVKRVSNLELPSVPKSSVSDAGFGACSKRARFTIKTIPDGVGIRRGASTEPRKATVGAVGRSSGSRPVSSETKPISESKPTPEIYPRRVIEEESDIEL